MGMRFDGLSVTLGPSPFGMKLPRSKAHEFSIPSTSPIVILRLVSSVLAGRKLYGICHIPVNFT